jgi:aspartate racemase
MEKTLGILGGMGPLASAELVKTIYDFNTGAIEQESPVCILYSDPTIPDRTDAILNCTEEILLKHLLKALDALCALGADKIVVACITIHYLLPRLPRYLREKIISLVDLIFDEVSATEERHLLLCTSGTRRAGIFQNHDGWESIRPQIVFTDDHDQNLVQDLILKIKTNQFNDSLCFLFDELSERYRVNSFIAGCTEFHVLVKRLIAQESGPQYRFLDPLLTLARELKRFINKSTCIPL